MELDKNDNTNSKNKIKNNEKGSNLIYTSEKCLNERVIFFCFFL